MIRKLLGFLFKPKGIMIESFYVKIPYNIGDPIYNYWKNPDYPSESPND